MWYDRRGMAVPDFQDFGAHLYPSRQVRDTGITFRASFLQRLRATPGECGYCLARRVPPLFLVLFGLLAMGHGTTPFATRYNGNQLSRARFLSVRHKAARALGHGPVRLVKMGYSPPRLPYSSIHATRMLVS